MKNNIVPKNYNALNYRERREMREAYIKAQKGMCMYCGEPLSSPPPQRIANKPINWDAFPANFLMHPVHLQHNHATGMTEGAVHAYCNAVMWQYEGR